MKSCSNVILVVAMIILLVVLGFTGAFKGYDAASNATNMVSCVFLPIFLSIPVLFIKLGFSGNKVDENHASLYSTVGFFWMVPCVFWIWVMIFQRTNGTSLIDGIVGSFIPFLLFLIGLAIFLDGSTTWFWIFKRRSESTALRAPEDRESPYFSFGRMIALIAIMIVFLGAAVLFNEFLISNLRG